VAAKDHESVNLIVVVRHPVRAKRMPCPLLNPLSDASGFVVSPMMLTQLGWSERQHTPNHFPTAIGVLL
jgi:hypothetical protein